MLCAQFSQSPPQPSLQATERRRQVSGYARWLVLLMSSPHAIPESPQTTRFPGSLMALVDRSRVNTGPMDTSKAPVPGSGVHHTPPCRESVTAPPQPFGN